MQDCKVDILGTEYSVFYRNVEDDTGLDDADGYTDPSSYEIVVRKNNPNGLSDFARIQKRALRHELIHAFLYESGIGSDFEHANKFGHEETMVDWFAIQSPKIFKIFKELDIL